MNSWFNVLAIVMILCIQNFFKVSTGAETKLSEKEGIWISVIVSSLYWEMAEVLKPNEEELISWTRNEEIRGKRHWDLEIYVQWVKKGAKILAEANKVKEQGKFDVQITNSKDNILKKIPVDAAASINEVLDSLNTALNGLFRMRGMELHSKEGARISAVVSILFLDIEKVLYPKGEELTPWINYEEVRGKRQCDLDIYVTWVKKGAIILADQNKTPQNGKFNDSIDKAKGDLQSNIPTDAANTINKILDDLKGALNECHTI